MKPRTLFEKIWDAHVIHEADGQALLYIDLHLVHEVTSPQAFDGLRLAGRRVRRPQRTVATMDHNVPTIDRHLPIQDELAAAQVDALIRNCREFGVELFDVSSPYQGIVHVIGPELGLTLPGSTIVCGDSHTATHGAFGALAFGIGTSEVEHVLATQTLHQTRPRTMEVRLVGRRGRGVSAKDIVLGVIGRLGTGAGAGHVVEYTGEVIRSLDMEERLTICNMSIEMGARAGMVAPDDTTFNYLEGRPRAPRGRDWERALEWWQTLPSDAGAAYDHSVEIDVSDLAPMVTWGTNPGQVVPVTGRVPDPGDFADPAQRAAAERALDYMDLKPGTPVQDIRIDRVFIGSCTNSRLSDLRAAARVVRGRRVAPHVKAWVVPGSQQVKAQAEAEGLDRIFREAGFEWREPGCSMCLGMNGDILAPGERCASTSNRNFEGRQGRGGRTHLVSPEMAAAAAIAGHFVDVREWDGMKPFTRHEGLAAPLNRRDVDTDQIIPKQFLKLVGRTGYGRHLFHDWRYLDDGQTPNPDFELNRPEYAGASILLARENFGSGSSREHAVWALMDYGFRVVIAPSFADIFYNNCFKNGLLPVTLAPDQVDRLFARTAGGQKLRLAVDLEACRVTGDGGLDFAFQIDPARRRRLLEGMDDISLTLRHEDRITAYEQSRAEAMPWL